jgi:hypothetical protein
MTEKTTATERFLLALLEYGEPWDECSKGIYENLKDGNMDCDETGREFWLTTAGMRLMRARHDAC